MRRNLPLHIILIFGAVFMLLPFFWMVSTSLKTPVESLRFPPTLIPEKLHFSNYKEAWETVPFPRYFLNTIIVTLFTLIGVLITSSLAAYAFATMEFKGKDKIFLLFLSSMMIPMPVYVIPCYLIISKIGWIDTYYALIVPWAANVFSIFLLRQHFKQIPKDLFEAAYIDGCSKFLFLWKVVIPLSKAALITVSIFTIIGSWNSFMWPLVVINDNLMRPIQVGLAYFSQGESTNYTLLMAASTFCIIPILIIFFLAQKNIIESYARSGLKE